MSTAAAALAVSSGTPADAAAGTIREGLAIVQRPPKEQEQAAAAAAAASAGGGGGDADVGQAVFYNPVQVFNRDLSILAIQTFVDDRKAEFTEKLERRTAKLAAYEVALAEAKAAGRPPPPTNLDPSYQPPSVFPGITILEALSATGLRSIRYFKEIGDVASIIVNDMDADAVKSIEYNIALNGLTTQQLIPSHADAITLMQKYRPPPFGPIVTPRPTVIDLDPYGTAAPFLDSAVQAIDEGGLLCITCTDKAILCGNYSETCWAKYGSMPLKGSFCHETAIRIVLNSIATACNRYGRHMVPLASLSIDFYVRVFVRVYTSPLVVKQQASVQGMLLACTGCEAFWPHAMGKVKVEGTAHKHTPNTVDMPLGPGAKCPECDGTLKMGGPFWLGPLHNKAFLAKALKKVQARPEKFATSQRIVGMLTVCAEELQEAEEAKMADRATMNQRRIQAQAEKAQAAAAQASTNPAAAPVAAAAADASASGSSVAPLTAAEKKAAAAARRESDHLNSLLYYSLPHLFQLVNSSCPKISLVRSALVNAGYAFSQTHALHSGIKTNAPPHVVWDVIRGWIREHPPKNGFKPDSVGARIMAKEPRFKADFTLVKGTDLSSTATGVPKFLPNPEDNWGPKAKAGVKRKANQPEDQVKRQKLNQNKRLRSRQCKTFAETGACPYDRNCRYAHVPGAKPGEDVSARLSESLSGPNATQTSADAPAAGDGEAEKGDAMEE